MAYFLCFTLFSSPSIYLLSILQSESEIPSCLVFVVLQTLPLCTPENMARWQHVTVSFCFLRGLNTSLFGDVLSCDILNVLPALHLGSSVRFPQWENPIESSQHGNLTISFWNSLWNLIPVLVVLQNGSMLKPHCILSSIKSHRNQLLFFVSNSIGFLSLLSWPYAYKRERLQGMSVCEKGFNSVPLLVICEKRPDQQPLSSG